MALLIGESYQNPGFFLALFREKGGTGGPRGGKVRGIRKNKKNPEEFPGQTGTPGTFPPEKSPESRKKSRGGRVRRDFSRIPENDPENPPRRRDSSGKKWKSRDFPGPPGPGPGAGPGGRQKSQLPAGFPNFIHALRPAPLTLPQRARNGAKQPPPGKLTVELFPLALSIGESYQNPGIFSHFL